MIRFNLGVPWAVVMGFVLAGAIIVVAGATKFGGVIMAMGPLAGCAMRAVLPERYVLDIKVRSRPVDIVLYGLAGVTVLTAFLLVRL